jgi:tripartite-type tricarboxylate transporter receptor subunit TctC
LLARVIGEQVSKAKGQTVIIENRPGGGTVIATESVARAAPDGTTVLLMANSFLINANLQPLSYDPFTSFESVCALVYQPLVFSVNSTSSIKSFADFVAAAKRVPSDLSVAAVGPNTALHVALEMLKRSARIDFNYVPFPGGAPAVSALVGKHVSAALATYSEIQEHVGTGLRPPVVAPPNGSQR